jgi:predicted permease
MNVFNFDFQEWIQFILQKVGSGVTPLALVSVGLQLRFESRSQHWQFWDLVCCIS